MRDCALLVTLGGRRTRRLFAAALLAAIASVAGRPEAATGPAADGDPSALTVAALLDLTGAGAALGEAERLGLRLAEQEIAGRGGVGRRRLRVVVIDSATSAAGGERGARHAVQQERALILVGTSTRAGTAAVADLARRAEVPLLALAGGGRQGEPAAARRWVFELPPGDALVADAIGRDLGRRGLRRVAWLEARGPIGTSGRAAFDAAARRHGLAVVARERLAAGEAEPGVAVGRLLDARPDALVVWATPPLAGAVAQAVHDVAPELPHYQSHAAGAASFLSLSGLAAAGVRTPYVKLPVAESLPDDDPQRPILLDFLRAARGRVGAAPSAFTGYGYDALRLAAAALTRLVEAGRADGPLARRRFDLRGAVEATRDLAGVNGIYSFAPDAQTGLDGRALVLLEAVVPPGASAAEWRLAR